MIHECRLHDIFGQHDAIETANPSVRPNRHEVWDERESIGVTVTLDIVAMGATVTPMPPTEVSIKELHGATGEIVRRAGASRIPLVITDHGEPVAILANPNVVSQARPRRNSLLPEFAEFLKRRTRTDVQSDLDDVRGDR